MCSKPQTSAPWRANNAISSPDYVPIRGVSNPDYWPMNPHSLPTAHKHRLRPTFTANGTNSCLIIGLVLIAIGYLLLAGQTPVPAPRHRTGKTTVFSDHRSYPSNLPETPVFSLDNRLRKSTSDFPQRCWVCQSVWPGGQRHLRLIWVEPDVCRRLATNVGSLAFNLGPQHLLLTNNLG